jgi:predicted regulator of Ras-like GTPase activity (Roadblock/LC7/MglB family)
MSLDFLERLASLNRQVEGSMGTALIGSDGIEIESLSAGLDMVDVGAEYAAILGDSRRASQDLNLGRVNSLFVLTDRTNLFFSLLKSDCFLMLAAANRGNWGRTRYEISRQARRFQEGI